MPPCSHGQWLGPSETLVSCCQDGSTTALVLISPGLCVMGKAWSQRGGPRPHSCLAFSSSGSLAYSATPFPGRCPHNAEGLRTKAGADEDGHCRWDVLNGQGGRTQRRWGKRGFGFVLGQSLVSVSQRPPRSSLHSNSRGWGYRLCRNRRP